MEAWECGFLGPSQTPPERRDERERGAEAEPQRKRGRSKSKSKSKSKEFHRSTITKCWHATPTVAKG
jgi:hypothetical protein